MGVWTRHPSMHPLALGAVLEGPDLVHRAFGELGSLACRHLSTADREGLEALARLKLTHAVRLNLLPYRSLLPGRLEGPPVRVLVSSVFSAESLRHWPQLSRGDREDLQRLAVVKHAAREQGVLDPHTDTPPPGG